MAPEMSPTAAGGGSDQGIRLSLRKCFEKMLDLFHVGKRMHSLRTPAQLSSGLRAAQHQHSQESQLAPPQVQRFTQAMRKFLDPMACTADFHHELLLP